MKTKKFLKKLIYDAELAKKDAERIFDTCLNAGRMMMPHEEEDYDQDLAVFRAARTLYEYHTVSGSEERARFPEFVIRTEIKI